MPNRFLFHAVLSVSLLAAATSRAANPWPDAQYLHRQYGASSNAMNCRVLKPLNFNPNSTEKHPVVIFFHGDGQLHTEFTVGDPMVGNSLQMADHGQYVFVTSANQAIFPCFFVLAQRHGLNRPASLDDGAMAIIDGIEGDPEFRAASGASKVDRDRLHLTGLSGGGGASVIIAGQRPGVFASGVFVCPPIPPEPWWVPANMSGLNTWFFHAIGDGTVTWRCSRNMVNELRQLGNRPIFTRYGNPDFDPTNEGSHAIWQQAYATPYLVPWVAAQRRGLPSGVDPATVDFVLPSSHLQYTSSTVFGNFSGTTSQLAAANPALQSVWFSRGDFVDIHRPATDSIANYQPAGGTVANWSFSNGEPVNQWQPNPHKFYVVATGTSWNASLGGVTYYSDTLLLTKPTTGSTDGTYPTLEFVSPTTGASYATLDPSVTVLGTAADNAGVAHVGWTNDRGGSGFAEGTTSWSAVAPLQTGTNVLAFKAYDTAGNATTKSLTVVRNAAPTPTPTPTPPPLPANGLQATYYNEKNLTGSSVSRVDPEINFAWGSGSPDSAIAADTFSARWNGKIQATVSGTYTFTVGSDDGSRLWIGETLIVDHWSDHGHTERSGTIVLAAGQKYPIKMEYYENTAGASAQLRWKPPGSEGAVVVPSSALTPPPANGLVGTYYDTKDFSGASFNRVDQTVSFYWGTGSPDPRIANDTFSVLWQGKVVPTVSGVHTFEIGSDDGSRLWVNGTLVATHWTDHGHTVRTGTIPLTAGQKYPIVLEYYENSSGASAELKWTPPSGTSSVIPSSAFLAEVDDAPLPPPPPSAPVRYDLGGNDAPTSETGWNNLTNVSVGSGVVDSVDTSGTSTGIGLSIVQAFNGVNSQGSTASGIYPANAIRDSVYVNAGQTGKLQLSGLKAASKYKLTFFASRAASDNVRVTKYSVGTASVTLDAALGGGNTAATAVLTGIAPSGSGVVEIEVTNNPGSTFGYLGVLEVQEEASAQSSNASPVGAVPSLVSAVSRQTHGTAGSFDLALPVSGTAGVETRQLSAGACQIVLTFSKPVGGATASLIGIGSVASPPAAAGNKITVDLSGVANAQALRLNLSDITASDGSPNGSVSLDFKVLAGDANGDGIVTDADVELVKAKLAPTINAANAAADINRSGALNTADVLLTSSKRGGSAL